MNDGNPKTLFVSIQDLAIAAGALSEELRCVNCGNKLHWLKDFDSAELFADVAGVVEYKLSCPACGIINSIRGKRQ